MEMLPTEVEFFVLLVLFCFVGAQDGTNFLKPNLSTSNLLGLGSNSPSPTLSKQKPSTSSRPPIYSSKSEEFSTMEPFNFIDLPSGVQPMMGVQMVAYINSDDSIPFVAKRYPRFEGKTLEELGVFLGLKTDPNIEKAKLYIVNSSNQHSLNSNANFTVPKKFAVNSKWPKCSNTFNIIQDQSTCACSWAVSTASVIQDRRCIKYNASQVGMSSWDLVSCCAACRLDSNGCNGGYPTEAFNYYIKSGLVTGGKYGGGGCKPYPVASDAANQPKETACSTKCTSSYRRMYGADKRHGTTFRVFSNSNSAVMQEIMTNGPVVATFHAYEDFFQYSSGVYQHSAGNLVGGHAVKIVGWGETSSGVKYWRVANSWGSNWGQGGFFNIIRGTNDCGFEEGIVSGTVLKD